MIISFQPSSFNLRYFNILDLNLHSTDTIHIWYKFIVVSFESVNLIGYITVLYLNNRVFLSRNYQTDSSET